MYKKGDKDEAGNHRGITLVDTDYKIYAEVVRQKLVKELQRKEVLSDTLMGYRPSRGTMDVIYFVKTRVENEIGKEKKKAFVTFADMSKVRLIWLKEKTYREKWSRRE